MDKNEYLVLFGKLMKELRKQKGLSQEELALLYELDRSYIGSGERNISLINIYKISKSLNISIKEFF